MNKDTLYTQTPLILDNPPSNVTDIEALYGAFIVSLTLLFVISFIKYFIGTDIKQKEVINIMIELPIDIFTIAITTLITFYYIVNSMNQMFILLLMSFVIMLLSSTFRRYAIKELNNDNIRIGRITIYTFFETALSFGGVFLIAIILSN